MGVDETVADEATPLIKPVRDTEQLLREAHQQLNARSAPTTTTKPLAATPAAAITVNDDGARDTANTCHTVEELRAAVGAFEGCALKKTAKRTVFGDGNPNASILVIGEAPGEDEDRQGIPFCGRSGQLLTRMLEAIGLNRSTDYYISNSLYWRPPGNRTPSTEELLLCRPFVLRLMEIMQPKLVILAGGIAAKSVLQQEVAVSRLRASTHTIALPNGTSIPARVLYHPAYLLRTPAQKAAAWADLLALRPLLEK